MSRTPYTTDNMLPVTESFYTLQGEGYNTGKAAFFIRLAGCDVGCSWCDSKISWDIKKSPIVSIDDIVSDIIRHGAEYAVITGGEPLMHPLDKLCSLLHENGIKILLETSGSSPLSGSFDWICLSPKRNKPPLSGVFKMASELKVIIKEFDDLLWAEENRVKVTKDCKLYLQPEWSSMDLILPDIIEYIKRNPKWTLSYQSHKFVNIP